MSPISTVYPMMGNDPEIFFMEKGKLVPAEILHPEELTNSDTNKSSLHADNAALEFNIPAAICLQVNNYHLGNGLSLLPKLLRKRGISSSLKGRFSVRPTEELTPEDVKRYRSVSEFGCEPSLVFNEGELKVSRPKVNPKKVLYRSTGFHVHMGSKTPEVLQKYEYEAKEVKMAKALHTTEGRVRLVQMCDLLAGLPAIFLERDDRVEIRRKTLGYGKSGEFREQPHGFEYRTLGSWPLVRPMWTWWANASCRDALNLVANDADKDILPKMDMAAVANAINSNDIGMALQLWTKVKKLLTPYMGEAGDWEFADRHPMLTHNTVMLFEFIVANGGLSFTNPEGFSFKHWLVNGEVRRHIGAEGFPSKAARLCEQNPFVRPKLAEWVKTWEFAKDNLSARL